MLCHAALRHREKDAAKSRAVCSFLHTEDANSDDDDSMALFDPLAMDELGL